MPRTDLSLPELWDYRPELPALQELDAFWSRTLAEQSVRPPEARFEPVVNGLVAVDTICPPSTVFAAFGSYAGPKDIAVYGFNDHEGGGPFHQARQAAWLAEVLS